MHAYTPDQILSAFRGATRSEVKKVTFAADFDTVEFDALEYYGWTDPKIPGGRTMCTWCNDVTLPEEAVLYSVRRAGAAGRRGGTLGTLICADFGCSRNVRRLPPAFHKDTDLDSIRAERVEDLRRKVHGFVDKVLDTDG